MQEFNDRNLSTLVEISVFLYECGTFYMEYG